MTDGRVRRAVALARAGIAASVDQALEWTDVELLAYTQIASEITEEEQQAFEDQRADGAAQDDPDGGGSDDAGDG